MPRHNRVAASGADVRAPRRDVRKMDASRINLHGQPESELKPPYDSRGREFGQSGKPEGVP